MQLATGVSGVELSNNRLVNQEIYICIATIYIVSMIFGNLLVIRAISECSD